MTIFYRRYYPENPFYPMVDELRLYPISLANAALLELSLRRRFDKPSLIRRGMIHVALAVFEELIGGMFCRGINATFIALAPKKDNPIEVRRPINLLTNVYKIFTKVLRVVMGYTILLFNVPS